MRILFIAFSVFQGGGTQVYIRHISDELKSRGHFVSFLSLNHKDAEYPREDHLHLKQFDTPIQRYVSRCFINLQLIFAACRQILSLRPDLICIHNTHNMNLSILLALLYTRIPVVQVAHDYGVLSCPSLRGVCINTGRICTKPLGMRCIYEKCVSKRYLPEFINYKISKAVSNHIVQHMITYTKNLKEWLIVSGVKHVHYLPRFSSVTPKNVTMITPRIGKNILYVGRLVKEKGVDDLIRAMKILIRKVPESRLYVVGEGPEKQGLSRLVEQLSLNRYIHFVGYISSESLSNYYNKCLCVVIPSIWKENGTFVALEAFAHRRPVIASDSGSMREYVIPNRTGILVPPRAPYRISSAVYRLMSDLDLSKRLGQNGYLMLEKKYSITKHVDGLDRIFNRTIHRRIS